MAGKYPYTKGKRSGGSSMKMQNPMGHGGFKKGSHAGKGSASSGIKRSRSSK